LGRIDKDKKAVEASKNVDAAQLKLLSGDTSPDAINKLIEESLNFGIAEYGDLGGSAVGTAGLVSTLGVNGVLGSLDQAVKDKIKARLDEIGTSAKFVIADIKATPYKGADGKEITGIDYLGTLIDEKTKSDMKLLNADGTTNSSALEKYLLTKQTNNPYYIASLQNASITSGMMEPGLGQEMLGDAFITGTTKDKYGTSTFGPSSSDPRLRIPPSQPGAVLGGPNANINITVTGVVDQTAIKQIQAVVAKALIERDERAQSPFTGVGKAFNP
jgi:hypothetical protein